MRARMLFLALTGLLLLPAVSSAQTPVIRGVAGYGVDDRLRLGLGGTVGVEFPFIRDRDFFIGVRSLFHWGSEAELDLDRFPDAVAPLSDVRQFHVGVEIGSTWVSDPVLVRTVGGVGLARITSRVELAGGTGGELVGTTNKVQYGPGLLIALPRDSGAFFGLEFRWVKVHDMDSALAIYGSVGKKLF